MPVRFLALLLTLLLGLTACGGGEGGQTAPTSEPGPSVTSDPAPTTAADGDSATASEEVLGETDADATSAAPADEAAQTGEAQASEPEETTAPSPLADGPVNVLIIGTDSRDPESMEGQADTILLLHLPADRQEPALISVTRDMWVPIPGLGEGKINSAFARGGTPTLTETVSQLLGGVEIDYTLQANFNGFINLTRWLGGIEVDNRHATSVTVESTGRHISFEEGPIWLENTDALIYSRQRQGLPLGDLDRTERQRAVLIGIMHRLQERLAEDPSAFPELVEQLYGNVRVTGDLDAADFVALVPLLTSIDPEDTHSLMVPITGFGTVSGQSVNIVDEARTTELGRALREDDIAGYVERHGTGYAP
ncbi:LCP family protein [Ornithinimicrobium sp. Y1847]|uniref:LCP family protein n=1 Tax=Ornithinimicrobium sp. Y1847 TaxID=3405419 RepID=UPI003B66ED46